MLNLESIANGTILLVRAHAGARQNAILGVRQGALRVAVTAAPEKGKANRAIVALLSDLLGVPKSMIELTSGETSSQKRFVVRGVDADRIHQSLQPHIDKQENIEEQ